MFLSDVSRIYRHHFGPEPSAEVWTIGPCGAGRPTCSSSRMADHVKHSPRREDRDGRQEERRGEGQEDRRTQEAHARHRRRREDRLKTYLEPWWERDPAALEAQIQELSAAGFRVRRKSLGDGRLALIIQDQKDTFGFVYGGGPGSSDLHAYSIWPNAEQSLAVQGMTPLWAIQQLRAGRGHALREDAGCVYVPSIFESGVTGAGGTLVLGQSRLTCGSYALRSLTGSGYAFEVPDPQFAAAFPDKVTGLWARSQRADAGIPDRWDAETAVSWFEATLAGAHGIPAAEVRRQGVLGLLGSWGGPPELAHWLFVRRDAQGRPQILNTQTWLWLDNHDRAPFSPQLADKRVTIIGCGAVGWTVALQLARSGVSDFVLYDPDLIVPWNLARLHGYLGEVGRAKVDALAQQLEAIRPRVQVKPHALDVGTHVGLQALLADAPDLLINLTGEEISTDETNAAAIIQNVPALFAWVSNGILAGRILRVRPGDSACYNCVREAAPAPIRTSGPLPTDGEHAWTGACFNADTFASAITRAAVLTLAEEAVSQRNPDHVVLDFEGVVPVAKQVNVLRDPGCSWCR